MDERIGSYCRSHLSLAWLGCLWLVRYIWASEPMKQSSISIGEYALISDVRWKYMLGVGCTLLPLEVAKADRCQV